MTPFLCLKKKKKKEGCINLHEKSFEAHLLWGMRMVGRKLSIRCNWAQGREIFVIYFTYFCID